MSKFKTKPVRINILIDNDLRKKYKKYCIDKDFLLSDRLRELIIKDINNEIK